MPSPKRRAVEAMDFQVAGPSNVRPPGDTMEYPNSPNSSESSSRDIPNPRDIPTPMDISTPQDTENVPNQNPATTGPVSILDAKIGIEIGDIFIPPPREHRSVGVESGARLVITHIVNKNFKSYAGVEVLGPFHKSFTAIIGPNGSGKSNVIDSMLFVFGYRASKLRSKKLSILIHNSSRLQNIKEATVAVHFCLIIDKPNNSYEIVPNSRFSLARTVFKDNTTVYHIDGKKVAFAIVEKKLNSYGIDLGYNRFLILQGEVEMISQMKPKGQNEGEVGLLEYLEDIIGTAQYVKPLEQLMERVEEKSEARKDKLNRVRMVETEKVTLEGPKNEALELVKLTNVMLRTKNKFLQMKLLKMNQTAATYNEQLQSTKGKLEDIDAKLDRLKDKLNEKTARLRAETEKFRELRDRKEEYTTRSSELKRKLATIIADRSLTEKKIRILETSLEQQRAKLIDHETSAINNQKSLEESNELLASRTQSKEELAGQLQDLYDNISAQTKTFREQKRVLQGREDELSKVAKEFTKRYNLLATEIKVLIEQEKMEMDKLALSGESSDEALRTLNAKLEEKKNLEEQIPIKRAAKADAERKLRDLKAEQNELTRNYNTLKAKVDDANANSSDYGSSSNNLSLRDIMEQKRLGNLSGVYGRLGDLGAIDERYDVAVSMACGSLDFILVDTVDTATACMDYLQSKDYGLQKFLILDKQKHFAPHMKKSTYPEGVPRLFDLIRVKDKRVLAAFYFATRDTLVAKDMNQAYRLAFNQSKRWRVVTLAGQIVEISGTVQGGGRSFSGKMSSTVRVNTNEVSHAQLQAWENDLQMLENRATNIASSIDETENLIASLQTSLGQITDTLKTVDFEVRNLKKQQPTNQDETTQRTLETCRAERQRLEAQQAENKVQMDEAVAKVNDIKRELREVEAQLSQLTDDNMKELQTKVNAAEAEIKSLNSKIVKLNVDIGTSGREAGKIRKNLITMERSFAELTTKMSNMDSSKEQLDNQVLEVTRQLEEVNEQLASGSSEFEALKKKIKDYTESQTKLQSERIEAVEAVKDAQEKYDEMASQIPIVRDVLASIVLEDPGDVHMPEVVRPGPLLVYTEEELSIFSMEDVEGELKAQKARIGDRKPNIQAILDYKAKLDVYLRRAAELDEITQERNTLRSAYDELRKRRITEFNDCFTLLTRKLKEMYQMITLGGDAELELVDTLDPFAEGVVFSVRPPQKSWKNISNLSGGEKTLSSLALVFALHYFKPSPLYVMDEIDAALDFKNVSIVSNYIKDRTKNAQFIIISLRYNMFEMSNRLVGIYKVSECTSSICINNRLPRSKTDSAEDETMPLEDVMALLAMEPRAQGLA